MMRYKNLRLLGAFVGVAVVTSGLLSACSTGQSPAASSTLKVLAWKGGGTEPAGIAEINAAFEKSHPGVKIDFTYMPAGDSYTQKLSAELLAGNAPDVFMGDPVSTKTLASSGYLADLGKQSWASDVLPDLKSFTQGSDGKVYAAPTELIGITTYANMDLLKKVGITEVPTTRSIFLDDMAKLKGAGITPLSLPDKSAWTAESTLQQIASTLVYRDDPKWDQKFIAGKTSFVRDWSSSAKQLVDLDSQGYVAWKSELGIDEWSQGLQDFKAGKSAFWVQGAWNLSGVHQAGINAQIFPWPADDGKQVATLFGGVMWQVNKASKADTVAKEYVDYWSTGHSAPFLNAENAISAFKSVSTPKSDATAPFNAAYAAGQYRILPYDTWLNGNGGQLGQAVQGMLLGQSTQQQLLATYDTLGRKALTSK